MTQTVNPKVPILMYHEVAPALLGRDQRFMTPLYVITQGLFEDHMRTLAERGYQSLFPEEVPGIRADGKYVVITFDDGLAGNHAYALPVLKKYGFKATFFVAVGSIASDRFMNWTELQDLVDNGMSVQSHTVSHKPLETLDSAEIREELAGSKREIERRLNTAVSTVSFPHGSYNRRVVYRKSFLADPPVLGRLAVTYKVSAKQLADWVDYKSVELLVATWSKRAKSLLRRIVGVKNYSRLYRIFFNIK